MVGRHKGLGTRRRSPKITFCKLLGEMVTDEDNAAWRDYPFLSKASVGVADKDFRVATKEISEQEQEHHALMELAFNKYCKVK